MRHTLPVVLIDKPFTVNQDIKVLVPREEDGCTPRFVQHSLTHRENELLARLVKSGTTVESVDWPTFHAIELDWPPSQERSRITKILDTLDEAIREAEAVIAKLRQVKAGLLHDLLTRGLDEHGHLRDPIRHPDQFQNSPLGLIPKAWRYRPIADHVASSAFGPRFAGEAYHDQGNVATMRTTDMDDEGNLDLPAMPLANLALSQFEKHLLQANDVLVSRSGTCGITAVFEGFTKPVLPGAFLIRFRLKADLLPQFLRAALNWQPNRQRLLLRAEGGVQKNLRTESISGLSLGFPEPDEQAAILKVLAAQDASLQTENEKLNKLQKLKSGLSHDLLTGSKRVKI